MTPVSTTVDSETPGEEAPEPGVPLPLIPLHVENWLARGLLMVAVLFAYAIAAPLLDPGYISGGDDIIHMAYDHEVATMLEAEQRLYGWSYLY